MIGLKGSLIITCIKFDCPTVWLSSRYNVQGVGSLAPAYSRVGLNLERVGLPTNEFDYLIVLHKRDLAGKGNLRRKSFNYVCLHEPVCIYVEEPNTVGNYWTSILIVGRLPVESYLEGLNILGDAVVHAEFDRSARRDSEQSLVIGKGGRRITRVAFSSYLEQNLVPENFSYIICSQVSYENCALGGERTGKQTENGNPFKVGAFNLHFVPGYQFHLVSGSYP